MTIKKILFGSVLAVGMVGTANAQYTEDVLLFSQGDNGGTARFKAMGGASTALGGDISSITGNPAGLGFYNQSDASATFRFQNNKNKSNYFGNKSDSKTDNFNIDNGGIVFHMPTTKYGGDLTRGWLNFNVGIAYNRTNLFNNKLDYQGINSDNSITHAYADQMFDQNGSEWANDLNSSLMFDKTTGKDKNFYFPLAEGRDNEQLNSVWTKGGKSETALSFGSNYSNKFYIGATFSLTDFRYEKSAVFTEYGMTKTAKGIEALNPDSKYLKPGSTESEFVDVDYELFDHYGQVTQGSGFDFKLGMIYKATPSLSLGFTAKTPTFMSITDESTAYTDINYFKPEAGTSFHDYGSKYYDSSYDYNLQTPYKLSAGVTQYFGAGLLTAEVEFVDYASMRWRDVNNYNKADEKQMNANIKDTYQAAFNVRVGGEVLFDQVFSGRAGFNYNGNPYKSADYKTYGISAGLGAKLGRGLYLDLTGVYQANNYKESPYLITYEGDWNTVSPSVDIKNSRTNVMLTIGSKF
ncbi:hypothetical protein ACFX5U_06260 [Sphingobacterium sp. SG20118]|uniref:hypothetical protein n=1 Tax=Sphingobacterium TaxID=28453 RepID=UPI0004F77D46|nr:MULTISPECIES: hypothetical protein [Sphingobacterium]AIM36570.1 hypothetical protein KO02_07530 [Sphingobacterium sp. ML3W]MDH5827254.1 hypothetical protein [Sphingobacterium faecium]